MFIVKQFLTSLHHDAELTIKVEPEDERFFASSFTNSSCYLEKLKLSELKELKETLQNYTPSTVAFATEKERFLESIDKTIHKLLLVTDTNYAFSEYKKQAEEKMKNLEDRNERLRKEIEFKENEVSELKNIMYFLRKDAGGIIQQAIEINEAAGAGSRKKVRELLQNLIEFQVDDEDDYEYPILKLN